MKILKILFLVFLASCTSKKRGYESYPQWYMEPTSSDERYFYATGKGPDKDKAIKDGLKEIAAQIKTVVSSKFQEETMTNNQFENHVTKMTVETETSNIEIYGYKIVNIHQMENYDFILLIQIEKSQVIKEYLNKFDKLKFSIMQKLKSNDFVFLKNKNKIAIELQESETILAILSSLNQKNMESVAELRNLEEEFIARNNKISFSVMAASEKLLQTVSVLKNAITEEGYKISDSDSASLHITVDGEILDDMQGRLFLVKQKVEIKLKDMNKVIHSSNVIEEVGSSSISFGDASLNTGVELRDKLRKIGFKKFVGLD